MVNVPRSGSGGGRGRRANTQVVAKSEGGRSVSRASSRASVPTPTRRVTRSTRARSSPRSGGDGREGDVTIAALRAEIVELRAEMEEHEDAVHQLRKEVDKLQVAQANTDSHPPGHAGAGTVGADAECVEKVAGTALPPPPSPAPQADLLRQAELEDFQTWRDPASLRLWFMTSERPMNTTLAADKLRLIVRGAGLVSPTVLDQLNSMSGFAVRTFIDYGDFVDGPSVPLHERLDVLISAVIGVLSVGTTSDTGVSRIASLREGLRRGRSILLSHFYECRSKMRIKANYDLLANIVDKDLNRWAGDWFQAAMIFGKHHRWAPAAREFPAVILPTWSGLSTYIEHGGLHNSNHQPQNLSTPESSGGARAMGGARTPTNQRAISQYCFAFASKAGCSRSAKNCRWIHALDPARTNARDASAGDVGRGGNRGGSASGGGGSSGGGSNNAARKCK